MMAYVSFGRMFEKVSDMGIELGLIIKRQVYIRQAVLYDGNDYFSNIWH